MMAWVTLGAAGLFEIGFVIGLKFTDGFTRLVPSLLTAVAGGVSFYLLSVALRTLPVGTAYAVWTAIGASGAVLVGVVLLDEPAGMLRIIAVAVVLGGVVMLRLAEQ